MTRLRQLLIVTGSAAMLAFLYLFLLRNAPGLSALPLLAALAGMYGLVYALATLYTLRHGKAMTGPATQRLTIVIGGGLLLWLFLDSAVVDYYQPLSLYDDAIAALVIWWGTLLILAGITLARPAGSPRGVALLIVLALCAWPLAAALPWLNKTEPGDAVIQHHHVFTGGVGGYHTYRIPGLLLIPAGATLADGTVLETDRILAFAEARRDAALDTGAIDLVLKHSDDGGQSWSKQEIICRHRDGELRGKCGNPTPLFDPGTGRVLLAYNLSGIKAPRRQHSGHLIVSKDGGASWGAARRIADVNLVFGPGKGLRLARAPHTGRLLLPAYLDGAALVLYSDDHGGTWQQGGTLPGGDESDVTELSDGTLYLATRHPAPIGRAPDPNGRKFSMSRDGGSSWSAARIDPGLPTPVCQAAVLASRRGGLYFVNPAHPRSRVRLSVRYSADEGEHWGPPVVVFPGPSGYSVLAESPAGDILVLYENGDMSYSRRISLARLPRSAFTAG